MFNLNGLVDSGSVPSYELVPISFSGTYKNLFYEWHEWLRNFEEILKGLIWYEAYVYYHGMPGDYSYNWRINVEYAQKIRDGDLKPITEWEFCGGPRAFY